MHCSRLVELLIKSIFNSLAHFLNKNEKIDWTQQEGYNVRHPGLSLTEAFTVAFRCHFFRSTGCEEHEKHV